MVPTKTTEEGSDTLHTRTERLEDPADRPLRLDRDCSRRAALPECWV